MENFKIDSPAEIIDSAILAQRELLSGFPGHENLDKKKFEEALNPNQVAISLTGEPTLYPKLSELIDEFHKQNFTTFLVSNGLHPEVLEKISLPTQLYISMEAPNEKLFKKLDRPIIKNAWKRFNQTLELLPSLKTRKAIRITAINGLNMSQEKEFAKLIEKAGPQYLEIKSYMFVGHSRKRLSISNMPTFQEILGFSEKIAGETGYIIKDFSLESRVVLLVREDLKNKSTKICPQD